MKIKDYKYKYWSILMALFMIMALLGFEGVSRAGDDDVPFFAGATGLPNVMFIFDNSDSMQDSPYMRKDGNTYRPSTYWRRGVTVDADGTIAENESGNIIYDDSAYVSEEELVLPGVNPPNFPGLASSSSTITSIAGDSSDRIYDSNVDWTYFDVDGWAKCAYTYRYWKVKITDDDGVEQIRNIYHCYTGGYWRVYNTIDYTGTQPYTYELMAGQPGEVTYKNESNLTLVYDKNFDWSTVTDWSDFSNNYRYRKLEITAGTNAGEVRNITGRNCSYGYWQVDAAFPEPCDHTTRYRILGSPDDSKYASGGNHPDSKLYQAKKAVKTFLESEAIKVCDQEDELGNCTQWRYLLNMGFATYMSARVPRVRAKYFRKTTYDTPDRCRAYYWRENSTYSHFYDPDGSENGYDFTAWGTDHEDISVGYEFDRLYQSGHCDEQTIHYTVTEITHYPTDSLPNRYRIRCDADYHYYTWLYFNVPEGEDCATYCESYAYPATYNDGSYNWTRASGCDAEHPPGCVEGGTGWYYQTYTYADTYGDYNQTDPDTPRYINPTTLMVTPYKGHCSGIPGDDWLCTDPDPEDTSGDGSGDWTLVTEDNAKYDVPINQSGDLGNIEPNTFDYSYFRYPCDGSDDRPHAWSYRKTADGYIYRYSTSYASTWGDAVQNDPFFPATVGDEKANHDGDDHVVFVNLPEYVEADDNKGDDVTGQNIAKILNYINLARVAYPYDTRYDCTMMPYNPTSLAVNSSTAVTGTGTPLAASLENAKEYYESYFTQDDFTQGGCRNSYVILLTDGLETCDGDPNAAAAALNSALIPDNESSIVKTYVIGFGLDDASKETLNALAAAGGTEQAYFAVNVEELVDVLTEDIMSEIVGDSYTRSSPVLTRLVEESDQLKIYSAYFDYPVWRGHLKAFNINDDGTIGDLVAEWTGACDDQAGNDADAGCEIKTHGRGTVYTTSAGSRIEFSTANLGTLKPLVNPDGEDINGNSTPNEDADASAVISYTLNPGYDSGKYVGTRDSNWPLGDIYNSVPVIVTKPNLSITYWTGYSTFVSDNPERPTIIYVGANDGMLHAIDDSNGQEIWAWIPNCVLGTLHEFKEGHRFTVDLAVKGADVDTSAGCDGSAWKTVVATGLRKGGNHYFAIDVTDPDNPQPMWEITDGNMGKTWSIPAFGRININGTATSVVFVGGGYSTDSNKGNRVYIIKASDGTIITEFTVGTTTNNVPSEILAVRYLLDDQGDPVDYITRANVDSALKGFTEVAYFGDTSGTLWKIKDLNADNPHWNPTLEALYVPENPRPIYHRPAIADVYQNCTRRFVLFGTGNENDPTGVNQNYFYEIEDREFDDSSGGPDEGSSWTSDQIDDGLFRMTWMKELDLGEKVFSDPTTYRNVVYFTTYQPQGGCQMGFSYLYGLTTTECGTEGGEGGLEFGLEDEELGGQEKIELGRSIATSPVLGPPRMYLQVPGGGGQGLGPPVSIKVPTDPGKLLYWREVD